MDNRLRLFRKLPGRVRNIIISSLLKDKAGSESKLLKYFFLECYNISIGYGTYGGCFDKDKIPPGTQFGNYCSVASGVKIFRANHPVNVFTCHPLFYNPVMGFVREDKLVRPQITIGNDVWIGANTIILPSCHAIGNGAIIGAGSVVTKDVPPYTIVAGNPAKIIRMRFNPKQIKFLEESKWWELKYNELTPKYNEIQEKLNSLA